MSHHISASCNGDTIATMDFNVSVRKNSYCFYRMIEAEEFDGEMSGINSGREFASDVLEHALTEYQKIAAEDATNEWDLEIEFLKECVGKTGVRIWFS